MGYTVEFIKTEYGSIYIEEETVEEVKDKFNHMNYKELDAGIDDGVYEMTQIYNEEEWIDAYEPA